MKIKCDCCKKKLKKKGALLFSPPKKRQSEKTHLCRTCFREVEKWINKR